MKLRKFTIWLIIALVTFSLGVIVTLRLRTPPKEEPRSKKVLTFIIPKSSWEKIFFKPINTVVRLTGQSDLRTTTFKPGEHEARIWWGFGLTALEGVTLRYVDGKWSAIHVQADEHYEVTKATRYELKPPHSGWDAVWKQLVDAGMLNLPDATEIDCGGGGVDGLSVVVETHIDHTYRTYMYQNPMLEECREAKQVVQITDVIYQLLPRDREGVVR